MMGFKACDLIWMVVFSGEYISETREAVSGSGWRDDCEGI